MTKVYEKDGKSYWENGIFYPDNTPIEMPLGYEEPESLEMMVARMVRSAREEKSDFPTMEEENDFDCNDEGDLLPTKYEFTEMTEEHLDAELRAARADVEAIEKEKASRGSGESEDVSPKKKPRKHLAKSKEVDGEDTAPAGAEQ